MEEIRRGGGTLRHVTSEDRARARGPVDTRDELLDQIRTGVTLRKVDPDELHHHDDAAGGSGGTGTMPSGIAGMLQKALQERSGALRFSSSEGEEDGEDDDDEWD